MSDDIASRLEFSQYSAQKLLKTVVIVVISSLLGIVCYYVLPISALLVFAILFVILLVARSVLVSQESNLLNVVGKK